MDASLPERGPASTGYDSQLSVEGNGPPLIYVPGMDGTGRLFYRQVPLLTPRFRVGTYRLRDDAERMDALIEDLDRAVAALDPGGGPAVVIGESERAAGRTRGINAVRGHPYRQRGLLGNVLLRRWSAGILSTTKEDLMASPRELRLDGAKHSMWARVVLVTLLLLAFCSGVTY